MKRLNTSIPEHLTPREQQILALVITGKQNKEIAEDLCLSVLTVQNHLHSIFRKLNVKTRTQAAIYALREEVEVV